MKKRTRYLLIILGFAVFGILAPAIVFFIRGVRPNFSNDPYQQTGILVVNTDPKGAKVFLNGAERDTTPATLRFLAPGEYTVTIKKDGYYDWSKRLEIKPGKVTWAAENIQNISLIKNSTAPTTIADGAMDFIIDHGTLFYLSGRNLVWAELNHPERTQNLALPIAVTHIMGLNDSNFFLLLGADSRLLFSAADKTFTDLTSIIEPDQHVEIGPDGTIITLAQGNLVSVDPKTKKENILLKNISAFTLVNRDVYYLTAGSSAVLLTNSFNSLSKTSGTTVFSGLPEAKTASIITSPQREIALMLDGTLYRINGQLEKIIGGVTGWRVNPSEDTITFTTAGEFGYYSFQADKTQLVTRDTSAIENPIISTRLGYSFYIRGHEARGLELDSRDRQNAYLLFKSDTVDKFSLNDDLTALYILDGNQIKVLEIR